MDKPYKKSRELGRTKPKEEEILKEEEASPTELMDTEVENAEVKGDFFFLNGYVGNASQVAVIKSDLVKQKDDLERASGKAIVGFVLMEEGSIMMLMED